MFEGLDDPMMPDKSPLTLRDLFDVLENLAQLEMAYFDAGRTYIVLRLESSSCIEPLYCEEEVGREWSNYIVYWNPDERRLILRLPSCNFFTAIELRLVSQAKMMDRTARTDVRYLLGSGCQHSGSLCQRVDIAALHSQTVRCLYRLCMRAALQTMVQSGPIPSLWAGHRPQTLEQLRKPGSELKYLREIHPLSRTVLTCTADSTT
jgi:hypothetical protein